MDAAICEQGFGGDDEDAGRKRVDCRTDFVRRWKRGGDTDIAVAGVAAMGEGAACRHHLDARCLGQRYDAMGAAVEHVKAYERAAARAGPSRDPCAAEPPLKHLLHRCE